MTDKSAKFELVKISDILVDDRLIPINEDHAKMLAASIEVEGLLNPITIRSTPNGKKKYTMVAGAHRYRACELLELEEITATTVKANATEARILEVTENIARNKMTVLERAVSIYAYRNAWEEKYGKIKRGNPEFSNSVNLTELGIEGKFSEVIAERLGFSKSFIERSQLIAKNLPQDLQNQIRDTRIADNQSQLLTLARLEPELRAKATKALQVSDNDFDAAMAALDNNKKAKLSPSEKRISAVYTNMNALSSSDRKKGFEELFKMFPEEARLAFESALPEESK